MFIHGPFATGIYLDAGILKSIDDEFLMEFVRERKNQIIDRNGPIPYMERIIKIRDYRKESIPCMEQKIDGIKLVLGDCDYEEVSNSTKYKFENNTVYFYECGIGIFSTRVTVTFQRAEKEISMASVEKAGIFAQKLVRKKFENQLLSFINMFSETVNKKEIRPLTRIASDYFSVGHLTWIHTVYFFCIPDFFDDNGRLRKELKENTSPDLSFLVNQVPHEMLSFKDRYLFITDFESGRSIIVTKKRFSEERIIQLVRLLETYQYFYDGLFQLDTFLLDEMYKSNIDHQKNPSESIDEKLEKLHKKIEELENLKSSTIRYLEQFRYGSNVLVRSGDRSLIEELEKQWDVERIEKGIRNKLDLFDKELSSNEQGLLGKQQEVSTDEQQYLNKLILVFTVITVGSLTAQIVELSPWSEAFELKTIFYKTQLWIVLISTGILVGFILLLYSRAGRAGQRYQAWRERRKKAVQENPK